MKGKMKQRHESVGGSVGNVVFTLGGLEGVGARKNPTKTHLKTGSSESTIVTSPREQGIIRIVLSSS